MHNDKNISYFKSKDKKDCNGCGICELNCPQKAIKMICDEEGFLYPEINLEKCNGCGICVLNCSNKKVINNYTTKVYAIKNKDNKERKKSASGGAFFCFAKKIIEEDGVVFGVEYNNSEICHNYACTLDECKKFTNSKYVRSNISKSYLKIKEFLELGKRVLFTGTPCQCYALRVFLKKEYNNLIICEIICHSNPSPKIFKMYIKNIEHITKKNVKEFNFRSKNEKSLYKAYAELDDGSFYVEDTFNTAFGKMLINRPSCEKCMFADINRKADITIGDFWGIENVFPEFYDRDGVSIVCINTTVGESFFEEVKELFEYKKTNVNDGFRNNHKKSLKRNKYREKFFKKIKQNKINENNIIKYMKKYTKTNMLKKIIRKIKRIKKEKING